MRRVDDDARRRLRPLWLAAICLSFCSCRAVTLPPGGMPGSGAYGEPAALPADAAMAGQAGAWMPPPPALAMPALSPPTLPPGAWSVSSADPAATAMGCPPCNLCGPCAPSACCVPPEAAPWRPPGISGIWPPDEYLCDGGDNAAPVAVARDWSVLGLDAEDTVAHFDTVDGRLEVVPSNRCCIYAPRFASVRQVSGLQVHELNERAAGIEVPLHLNSQDSRQGPTVVNQPLQPEKYVVANAPQQFRERVNGNDLASAEGLLDVTNRFKAYEDLQLIRNGIFDNAEKARLAEGMAAALVWASDQAVQVILDGEALIEVTGVSGAQSVSRYELGGKPRLRICKVASTCSAQPGDEVEFTIRFDNIGDQVIGNVTIVDSLTTRLAYIADSATCSREANFGTQANEGESLVLRWEIREPLNVGEGGIIRFKCRVR